MRLRNIWQYTLGFAVAASVVGCGGGDQSTSDKPSPSAAAPAGQQVDAATAGNVTGMAMLDGTAPANEGIKMNADPVCVKENKGPQLQETFVVGGDGALGNVFVYVKDGLGNYVYDPPTEPAIIDQKGCRYRPHVLGVRVDQPIQIINSDPTLHNIHALPKVNKEFNNGQPIQGMKMTHTFTAKEVIVPFKCDVHGWMNAYVGVLDHPYFAVTGADGKFELKSLPPGTYTIEAWHERLGASTESVTLGAKETKDVMFRFKAPATATD